MPAFEMNSKVAVVTGATRGIGRALAASFAEAGIGVIGCGPDADRRMIQGAEDRAPIELVRCDITDEMQVQWLWDFVAKKGGGVGWWVNNAGLALTGHPLVEMPAGDLGRMIDINVLGTMNGCRVAASGMRRQGYGEIWNMLGAGWDGSPVPGMNGYATTKAALTFMTRALAAEAEGEPYIVGGLSPGLVLTEGFFREHARVPEERRAERDAVVNIIADHPETVAAWITQSVLAGQDNGAILTWLTPEKIAERRAQDPPRDILSVYRAAKL